jgi:hypothetical protein
MNAETTEHLARELARQSAAVQPIPALRVAVLRILAVAAAMAAAFLVVRGVTTQFLSAPELVRAFGAVVAGISLMAGGATVAALAMSVPGREGPARAGLIAAGVGALLALGVAPLLLLGAPRPATAIAPGMDLHCLLSACAVGIPPAIAALWFVARAAPHRPGWAVFVASTGAVGLGALAAQWSCSLMGLRHLVMGHALAPILGGLALAVPLLGLLRVLRRRR